jgi:hypothetical protein
MALLQFPACIVMEKMVPEGNAAYLTAIVGQSTRRHGLLLAENAVNTSV